MEEELTVKEKSSHVALIMGFLYTAAAIAAAVASILAKQDGIIPWWIGVSLLWFWDAMVWKKRYDKVSKQVRELTKEPKTRKL